MEPESLIPLSVVAPGKEESALANPVRPVVVLCGDIKQLPAIVSSDHARQGGLDVSLLERLMERPLYEESEQHITCLAMNYRSHSGILWLPNTLFYNNRLQTCNNVPLSKWPGLPNPDLPILVKHVEAEDDWVEEVSQTSSECSIVKTKFAPFCRAPAGSIKLRSRNAEILSSPFSPVQTDSANQRSVWLRHGGSKY